ncbi:MAG: hypothetical protein IT457_13845 [Planctomycetes bacterium]|nr:hypothetical protein [Planctomycetota bacterium]
MRTAAPAESRAVLAVLLGPLLLLGVWYALQSGRAPPAETGPADRTAGASAPAGGAESGAVAAEAGRAATEIPSELAARDADGTDRFAVFVTDAAGQPLPGVDVRLLASLGEGHRWLSAEEAGPRLLASAATDASGRASFGLPAASSFRLEAALTRYGTERSGPHTAGQSLEVRLRPAASLSGRVSLDGVGLAAVRVRVRRVEDGRPGRASWLGETRTDASGAYRLAGLAAGAAEIDVLPAIGAIPRGTVVELTPGRETVHDVALEPGLRVTGRVVDAETGAGLAAARVGLGWRALRPVDCDGDGRFEYRGYSAAFGELCAAAPGYGELTLAVAREVDAPALEFRLRRARRASGRIVTPQGHGIASVHVVAAGYEVRDAEPQRIDWKSTTSDAAGGYELTGLRADVAHVLLAHAPGFGVRQLEFPADESEQAEIRLPDLVLEPGLTLRGVVVDESGRPRPSQGVLLRGDAEGRYPRGVARPEGYRSVDSYVAERGALTDALGRFVFVDLAPGSYRVAALLPLGRVGTAQELVLERGPEPAALRLVQFVGLAIAGQVRVGDGGVLPHCYVSVDPIDGAATATDVECDRDGRFVATGLARGVYRVTVYPYPSENDRAAGRIFEARSVEPVPAGREDLAIELERRRGG